MVLVEFPQHEIREEHIHHVLKTTRPSVPVQERERLRKMYVCPDEDFLFIC